jgi:hypothetical protein
MRNYIPAIIAGVAVLALCSVAVFKYQSSNEAEAKAQTAKKEFNDARLADQGTTFGGGSKTKRRKLYKNKSKSKK